MGMYSKQIYRLHLVSAPTREWNDLNRLLTPMDLLYTFRRNLSHDDHGSQLLATGFLQPYSGATDISRSAIVPSPLTLPVGVTGYSSLSSV